MPTLPLLPLLAPEWPGQAVFMMVLLLFFGILAAVSVAAILGLTPDTHRQASQHGDFQF